jgi:hypothetical protein
MTKVDAIKKVMQDNGGIASWKLIYNDIEKYYPSIKASPDWEAGIRGVLYREIRSQHTFKKIGFGIFALIEYQEEKQLEQIKKDKIKMHSYMEGVMVEIGNFENFTTYCADNSAKYQQNVTIGELTTIDEFPNFTYTELIQIAKRIDVIWFSPKGYKFPRRLIEVVDSIGTLENSLSRMYQLKEFQTNFFILAPEEHKEKIQNALNKEPYLISADRFIIKTYDETIQYYNTRLELEKVKF